MKKGYTFDDVLLVPQKSGLNSRSEVDLSSELKGGINLDVPVISASMDSVTGPGMAQEMNKAGGVGIIHRFCSIKEQSDMVESVDGLVGAAIGVSEDDINNRVSSLMMSGADFLCIDVAHGHMDSVISATKEINNMYPQVPLMVGAVATRQGAKDLASAGADMVRVGVGPGSSCLTREKAGVGVPQISAIENARRNPYNASIIADGGIKKPGDIMKALMAGADAVIIGGLLGACEESLAPIVEKDDELYKEVRGMASKEAQEGFKHIEEVYVEGDSYLTPLSGTVEQKMEAFEKGIRSGISYCGGKTIEDARENADFIKVTGNTVHRNGVHGS